MDRSAPTAMNATAATAAPDAPDAPDAPRAPDATIEALVATVQHNCHVADARHAAAMTMCTYLLQMREFFRWEQGFALGATLPREAVGAWLAEREALWEGLAHEDYQPLPLPAAPLRDEAGGSGAGDTKLADPFDSDTINAALAPAGLLYGAGLVGNERPVFFVAELHSRSEREGLTVLQTGRERARTLLAPPAALAGGGAGPIVLRRESMARWCWERTEAHAMRPRPGSALHAMLAHYGLARDFAAALPRWLDDQCETAVLHELGEHRLGERWGGRWSELRAAVAAHASRAGRAEHAAQAWRGEALVRALRDQLADLGTTLPALLAQGNDGTDGTNGAHGNGGALHAWFAGYEGLREATFPALAAGYQAWRGGDGGELLRAQCAHGLGHFEAVAATLLEEESAAQREAALARFLAAPGAQGVPPSLVCDWPAGAPA